MRVKMKIRTKMLVYVLITSIIVLAVTGFYIQWHSYRLSMGNARQIVGNYAEKVANQARAEMEFDLGYSRSLANAFNGFYRLDSTTRDSIYFRIIKDQIKENSRYSTIWFSLEYSATKPNYHKTFGRRIVLSFMLDGEPHVRAEERNLTGDATGSDYYLAKTTNQELITDPYFEKVDRVNDVLVASICSPIQKDGGFVGLAGVDITLDKFQKRIENVKPYPGTQAFLLSTNSTIIAHTNEIYSGKEFFDIYPELEVAHKISQKVRRGTPLQFQWDVDGKEYLYFINPIFIGEISSPWAIGLSIPVKEIYADVRNTTQNAIWVSIMGIIVLGFVLFLISKSITEPIVRTTDVLNDLAQGDIALGKRMSIDSGDEIAMMATSVNKLIEGLNLTENFAREIGKGNLDAEFQLLGEKDTLGAALVEMQKSLKQAKEQELQRKDEEQKQNWATQGMAMFGDILRQDNDDLNELTYNIIKNLVDYTGSNQGGVFVLNENDREHPFIEMTACYAYDRRRFLQKHIELNEGLVGRCLRESKTIFMTDVPSDYINISSGLGKERPRCLILIPLKNNDDTLGVLELATFKVYEKYQVVFLEKVAESIASTIASVKINIRTAELLARSQQQAEEMQAQDEEMRQNMEELQATQEEMERKRLEQEEIQQNLSKELTLLNALMQNIPDYIYFKDTHSQFIRVSKSMLKLFNVESSDELTGKTDFDFHSKENAQVFYNEEQEIIKTMSPVVDKVVHETFEDGTDQWVSTTKMPLFNAEGNVVGTWGISKIVTDLKKAEMAAQQLASEGEKIKSMLTLQEGEYKAIVRALDAATFITEYNPDGFIIRINDAMQSVLGATSAEVAGKHHSDFFRMKSDDDIAYQEFWNDLRKGVIRQRLFKATINSQRIVLNETYSPVMDAQGKVDKIIVISIRA